MNYLNDSSINANAIEFQVRSLASNIVISILLIVIMLIAIIGNTAVIFAVVNCSHLREEMSNILTVNLAITDLGNGIFVMFFALIAIGSDEWIFGQVMCDINCAMNYCFMITSMITLCAISIDRYQAVHNPFMYETRITRSRLLVAAIYAWFQGLIFSIVPVIMRWVEYDYWEAICAINWYKNKQKAVYYVIAAFLMCFLFPGLLLTYNYIKMLCAVRQLVQPVVPASQDQQYNLTPKEKRKNYNTSSKAIRSLLIVAIAYFICFTPFSVTKLIKVISVTNDSVPGYASSVASLVAYCSSAVNPLIYGIFRTDFRIAYKLQFNRLLKKFGGSDYFQGVFTTN